MAKVIHADDQATFQREVLDSTVPVMVDFWAARCGPCRAVGPDVEALSDQYGTAIKVVKVDVDANQAIASQYNMLLCRGVISDRGVDGLDVAVDDGGAGHDGTPEFLWNARQRIDVLDGGKGLQ